jgi:hypothetical protein
MRVDKFDSERDLAWSRSWQIKNLGVYNPSDLWVGENAIFIIVTYANSSLLELSTSGDLLSNISIEGFIYDIWCDDQAIYACGGEGDYFSSNKTLMKLDFNGTILWKRTWQDTFEPYTREYNAAIISDGASIYSCGNNIPSTYEIPYELVLSKWDMDGNLVWKKSYLGATGSDVIFDGTSIYTCGTKLVFYTTDSYTGAGNDAVLIKWNQSGDVVWSRTWGDANLDEFLAIWGDGVNVYATGFTCPMHLDPPSQIYITLVKWDPLGNLLWEEMWHPLSKTSFFANSIWGDGESIYVAGASALSGCDTNNPCYEDAVLVEFSAPACAQKYIGSTWFQIFSVITAIALVTTALIALVDVIRRKRAAAHFIGNKSEIVWKGGAANSHLQPGPVEKPAKG